MNIKKHFHKTRVRYAETDQMGVVYYGNYALYFEMGRTEWLRSLGISYKWLEEQGIILPVVDLNVKFLKSAFYDDELTIVTTLQKMPTVKIGFDYEIYNEHQELLTKGSTTLVFIDKKSQKIIKAPSVIIEKLNGN